jgi:hypothetical protein
MKSWSSASRTQKLHILKRGLKHQHEHRGLLNSAKIAAAEKDFSLPSKWTDLCVFSSLFKLVHGHRAVLKASDYFILCDTGKIVISF